MGTDYTVHLGPYIKVHNPATPSTTECYCCPNVNCKQYKKKASETAVFCFTCGYKIKLITFLSDKPRKFDVYTEYDGNLREAMTEYKPKGHNDYTFLISNKKEGPHISFNPERECYAQSITQTTISESIDTFTKIHEKDIAKLRKVFGDDAVKIHYGILSWAW